MRLRLLVLIIPIILFNNAHASDRAADVKNIAFDNIATEFTTCASYFSIVSRALEDSSKKEGITKYEKAMQGALDYALIAAQEGRTSEMAQKVTLARFEMNLKEMIKEIDGNFSNISVLMNKYAYRCKAVMENPEAMMEEWINKAIGEKYKQADKAKDKTIR